MRLQIVCKRTRSEQQKISECSGGEEKKYNIGEIVVVWLERDKRVYIGNDREKVR